MAVATHKRLETVESKVETLEEVFKQYIWQSNREMKSFRSEMKLERQKTDFQIGNLSTEMKEFKDEMKEFKDEMKAYKKESNKKWGDLANRLGTFAEDIAAPNIPTIAQDYFGLGQYESFTIRTDRYMPGNKNIFKEFDAIAVYPDTVILNETKATVRNNYVDDFVEFISEGVFYQFFPEYQGKRLIPIFAGMEISDNHLKKLTANRIYAMAMSNGTMDLLNFDEVNMN